MFGKIIYYDKSAVSEYKTIISGKPNLEISEYSISNGKGINADFKVLGADAKSTKSYTAKIQESNMYDCAEFEKMLCGRDDFCDFTTSADYDILRVSSRSIIKADGIIEIPEEFDMVKLIEVLKPLLMDANQYEDLEDNGRAALETFVGNAQATKIPIVFELDGQILCGKLFQQNLLIDYEELSEIDEVTVLARVVTSLVDKSKPYYDPLKDFMKMNRMMRRSIDNKDNTFKSINADSDYRTIEILAIYQ